MIKRTCWVEQASFTDQDCRNPEKSVTERKVGTKEADRMVNRGGDMEQGWGKLSQAPPQGQPKGTESY